VNRKTSRITNWWRKEESKQHTNFGKIITKNADAMIWKPFVNLTIEESGNLEEDELQNVNQRKSTDIKNEEPKEKEEESKPVEIDPKPIAKNEQKPIEVPKKKNKKKTRQVKKGPRKLLPYEQILNDFKWLQSRWEGV